jgi:hypothetical protein
MRLSHCIAKSFSCRCNVSCENTCNIFSKIIFFLLYTKNSSMISKIALLICGLGCLAVRSLIFFSKDPGLDTWLYKRFFSPFSLQWFKTYYDNNQELWRYASTKWNTDMVTYPQIFCGNEIECYKKYYKTDTLLRSIAYILRFSTIWH